MSKVTAVGIDLGTTYSCVAVAQNGKVRIVENEQGNRTTPSCVAFTELEHIIGDVAKTQSALNPTNTVFDAKRLIGRNFSDPTVQADIKHWPFKVVNVNGRPKIEIVFKGEKKRFFPEEISSMVLTKMKETAETFVGSTVKDVVVTVPAYFNNSQRMSTKNAGRLAGLNVLRIINEPTAAALAYGMDHKSSEKRHVLVYDLGGGTFDVSIVTLENGVVEVKATGGDTHLGGEDFDNRLVDHFVKEIAQKHKVDLKGDMKTLRRLRNACERAKRNLSSATQTYIDIECNGKNFLSTISRARFEGMNEDLFSSTLETVDTVIKDAGITKNMIHEVVLVGGSTRIPRIQDMLKEYFGDVAINKSINPDEAVAYGAAIHASVIQGDVSEAMKDLVLLDVTPLSLGTSILGDKMSVIIKRNTSIPCSLSQSYCTVCDDQTRLDFSVHEGERIIASENTLLAKFIVDDIPPAPAGRSGNIVTFEIDNNGILHVTSVVKGTGAKLKMSITDQLWLKSDDIEKMLQDAETFRQIDAKRSERLVAISDLEVYCYNSKRRIQKKFNYSGTTQSDRALSDIAECMKWLDSNNEADAQVYKNRLSKLKIICDPLINV